MNKVLIILIIFGFYLPVKAQKLSDLGGAEKVWVLLHPFSGKKAKRKSNQAKKVSDRVSVTKDWLPINSGGRKDAFRHGIWMSLLSTRIGPKRAIWLGKAHEKKNKKDFFKRRLEDGEYPDYWAVKMDLYNNRIGSKLVERGDAELNDLIDLVLSCIEKGKFQMIKMDLNGNSLRLDGSILSKEEWQTIWKSERVLIPTY